MRQFFDLVSRFRKDEHGAFAIIFAAISVVIIALAGAAVDFTSLEQTRTKAQVALDAAALALQPTIYTTPNTIQAAAQSLIAGQLATGGVPLQSCSANKPPCVTVAAPVWDTTAGQLTLTANLQVPMDFVSLVGVTKIPAQIVSVATRKKLNLEVAMVLDNSGSMTTSFGSGTRMSVLQDSAKCAANILFYGTKLCSDSTTGKAVLDDVKMAVVPFNDEVNVGTANATATWLDRTGGSDNYFDNDNFDSDDDDSTLYNGNVDRISLFSGMTDRNGHAVSWGGCVEARYNDGDTKQYDTNDTVPDPADRQTMFTPLFAPDEPDSGGYSNNYTSDTPAACNQIGPCSITTTYQQTVSSSSSTVTVVKTNSSNGKVTSTQGPTTTTTTTTSNGSSSTTATATNAQGGTRTIANVCSCTGQTIISNTTGNGTSTTTDTTPRNPTTTTSSTKSGTTTTTTTTVSSSTTTTPISSVQTCRAPFAPWALNASGASSGSGLSPREMQERMCKYSGAQLTKTIKTGVGPNADCPASAIQPLTNVPTSITSAVNSMVAAGNTNIQEGTAWGFRVLSPTAPFTEGQPYDAATSKVMIVMTDGENTYDTNSTMNGSGLYAAYGYPWDNFRNSTTGTGYRGRMGNSTWSEARYEQEINSRLTTTCTNAKAAGITIYTIGLATNATSDPTGNTTLLTNCATVPADAYFPTTATALQDAFSNIANQLAALRIAQ